MYDRDAILTATDLRALADDELGPRKPPGASGKWRCPSTEHAAQTGRTPPVSIFGTQHGERWRCHGCGAGGTAVDLLVATRGLKVRDAFELLAGRAGIAPDQPWTPRPPAPRRRAARSAPPELVEPDGLRDYVEDCARRLWLPAGRPVRDWLTHGRGIPADVLELNRIGADPGCRIQPRPDGVPRIFSPAAVFPVLHDQLVVYAQLRRLYPREDQPKCLSVAGRLARNPKLAFYRAAEPTGNCVIVAEGPTDALSAAAAGYTAAAVLGARAADPEVADRLARHPGLLVVAFDSDQAGRQGADHLVDLLHERHRSAVQVHVPTGHDDLNDWMLAADAWPHTLHAAVQAATRLTFCRPPLAIGM